MNLEKCRKKIEERIGKRRMEHTLRVVETAQKLAKHYGVDLEKAKIAAFFHDCAKIRDQEKLFQTSDKYGLSLSKEMRAAPQIIHSYLGAIIAEKEYNVQEEDILNAIRYHTTGREHMSDLEKIIFLADYIEPGRDFPGVEKARELAAKDLDEAMSYCLTHTISFLLENNGVIALDTVKARNYLLEKNL